MKKNVQSLNITVARGDPEHSQQPQSPQASDMIFSHSINCFPEIHNRSVEAYIRRWSKENIHIEMPKSARVSKLSPRTSLQHNHYQQYYNSNSNNTSCSYSSSISNNHIDFIGSVYDGALARMEGSYAGPECHSAHVSEVQIRHANIVREKQKTKLAVVGEREARRNRIHNNAKHVRERKREAEINIKREFWIKVILIASFVNKCRQAVRVLHKTLRAYDNIKRLIPIYHKRMKIRKIQEERRAYDALRAPDNPRPDIDTLSKIRVTGASFFESWNEVDLYLFLSYMKPASFKIGTYIMHYGDYDRVMYIVMKGTVEVQVLKREGNKRRNRENAQCFPLTTPTYIGEFGLLCKEPRSASVQCLTDVDCWKIERDDFEKVLTRLSAELLEKLEIATNERRVENLMNFFPLKVDQLKMYPFLKCLSDEVLKDVVSAMTPHVIRKNHILYREGDSDAEIYFLCEGQVHMTKPSAEKRALLVNRQELSNVNIKSQSKSSRQINTDINKNHNSPKAVEDAARLPVAKYVVSSAPDQWTAYKGHALGVFETLFLHEGKNYTATCTVNSELWSLKRSALDSICMNYPGCLDESREMIKNQYATLLTRSLATVPYYLLNDPYLRHVLSPHGFQQLWAMAKPRVAVAGDIILETGKPVVELYIVTSGRLSIQYSNRGGSSDDSGWNDDITVDPKWLGVYSNRGSECRNLYDLFPSVVRIVRPSIQQRNITQSNKTGALTTPRNRKSMTSAIVSNNGKTPTQLNNELSPQCVTDHNSEAKLVNCQENPDKDISVQYLPSCRPRHSYSHPFQPPRNRDNVYSGRGRIDGVFSASTNNSSPISTTHQSKDVLSVTNCRPIISNPPDTTVNSSLETNTTTVHDIGVVIGAFEVAASRPMYFRTVSCSSRVEMWTVDVKEFLSSFANTTTSTSEKLFGPAGSGLLPEVKLHTAGNRQKHCIIGDLAVSDYILKADRDKAAVRQLLVDPVYIRQHCGPQLLSPRTRGARHV